VIVMDDADPVIAADGVLFGCMLYSGQICESSTRALVPHSQYDAFVQRLVDRASTIKLGDPDDLDTDMGPVISERQRDRILGYIESATNEGATIALGGGVPDGFDKGYWIEPTIIRDVTNDMTVALEEIFGPVLVVIPYDGLDEAITIANDTPYGLTAGIWAGNYEDALEVGAQLKAGSIWINNWHAVYPELPFGGYKQSGVGRELGPDALNEYTEAKHVHLDLTQEHGRHIFDILLSEPPADE
jgi:acyl-CoA reductase-like NAD-dependent aldehyde dehydrogenase